MKINDLYIEACRGDEGSERKLFQALAVRFRLFLAQRVGSEQDIEEIVQDTLMTIYGEYKDLKVISSFSAWAYKVLENRMLSYFSTQSRLTVREKYIEKIYRSLKPDNPIDLEELQGRLLDCLKKICGVNPRYARILNLHYQGYGTNDICRKLNITAGNFYTILSRARSLLEYCLDKEEIG